MTNAHFPPNPNNNGNNHNDSIIHRLLPLSLLAVLLMLSYKIVAFFISPVIWAAILAYVTWPAYRWLNAVLKNKANVSAFIMTSVLFLVIGIPLIWGITLLQQEALNLYSVVLHRIKNGYLNLPNSIKNLPTVGQYIKDALWEINKDPEGTLEAIRKWVQSHLSYGREIVDVLAKNMAKFGIAVMMLFFFYRDGTEILKQTRQASHQILGDRVNDYFNAIGSTTQAVVYGIGLTALAQASLAGVGYFVANAPNPLLLTLMTFVIALIPFGTPFAWGGVVVYLFSKGQTTEAIGLFLWGTFVVGWVDNLIRPLVISGATKIPFMIILIGVLGGLSAFGFIGLFIGPVVLAVALAVWREWINQHSDEIAMTESSTENTTENTVDHVTKAENPPTDNEVASETANENGTAKESTIKESATKESIAKET